MNYSDLKNNGLGGYLEWLQSQGRYSFTKDEALIALQCHETTFDRAVIRLSAKNRLLPIKPGFLTIVPLEYQSWGNLPPEWFIKDLMNYLDLPYYVGLLSAAAIHGAAHQKPQQFQVITNQVVRSIQKKRLHIEFFKNEPIDKVPVKWIQTQTGQIKISTPEATVLDLVRFYKRAGYFNNVATVLSELVDQLDKDLLIETIKSVHYEGPVIQRLGYLLSLEEVGGEHLAAPLAEWVKNTRPRYVALTPTQKHQETDRVKRWRLFANEKVEIDL